MLPARATDGHGEVLSVCCFVARKPLQDERFDIVDHVLYHGLALHILHNLRNPAGKRTQMRIIVGIGKVADIENKVGRDRDAVLIAEGLEG